jgi:hypothetical protein
MKLQALPKGEWERTAIDLARRCAGWLVSVEEQVQSLSEGDVETSVLVHERPFLGLAWRGGRLVLEFEGERKAREHHALEHCVSWSRLADDAGTAQLRVEDAGGRTTVLSFRRP